MYLRILTLEQLKGVSLDAQDERLRAYCQMNGLEVDRKDSFRCLHQHSALQAVNTEPQNEIDYI